MLIIDLVLGIILVCLGMAVYAMMCLVWLAFRWASLREEKALGCYGTVTLYFPDYGLKTRERRIKRAWRRNRGNV